MKNCRNIFIIFLLIGIIFVPLTNVFAHSVELDPESLITMPYSIANGVGVIRISDSVTDYTLYYQAVNISSSTYSEIEAYQTEGESVLETLQQRLDSVSIELDNLYEAYIAATDAYTEALSNQDISETELAALLETYETAHINYQDKYAEYTDLIAEYNSTANEYNTKINELTPSYIEDNWIESTDNQITIDTSQFSGEQPYVIWVKLVTSDGTIYYDEGIYVMNGQSTNIEVTGLSLDETSLSLEVGESYTLAATITPSNASNVILEWSSDNEAVATVMDNGRVTAVSEGTATITVTTSDGNYSASCEVTVTGENSTTNDPTIADGSLPYTGIANIVIISTIVIGCSILGFIFYKKYRYLNIK